MLGFPHTYSLHESAQADQGVVDVPTSPDFGGASVTIPLKLDIMPHLQSVSEDAKIIGAVNTIVPRNGELHGENTDWQAIYQAAKTNLQSSILANTASTALVIGAGGTCRAALYAVHRLGLKKIYLFNRTPENAEKVRDSFPDYGIEVITSLSSATLPAESAPSVVISTVPGDSLTTDSSASASGIFLDSAVLASSKGGVAIDLAYKPHTTALLSLAENKDGWKIVPGVEILCLQGFKQFELWTGKKAPEAKIRKAVLDKYFGRD